MRLLADGREQEHRIECCDLEHADLGHAEKVSDMLDRLLRQPPVMLLLRAPQQRDHRRLLAAGWILRDLLLGPRAVPRREGEFLRLKMRVCKATNGHRFKSLYGTAARRFAVLNLDGAPDQRLVLLEDELKERAAEIGTDHLVTFGQIFSDAGFVLRVCRGGAQDCRAYQQRGPDHRSTSPNTISSEPRIADTSASMWPRQMKSIACRCAKP